VMAHAAERRWPARRGEISASVGRHRHLRATACCPARRGSMGGGHPSGRGRLTSTDLLAEADLILT
jgi:hypothetical protein